MQLTAIRTKIDALDQKILHLLVRRQKLILQVAQVKKLAQKAIRDERREQAILAKLIQAGQAAGLTKTDIQRIWQAIFRSARTEQKKIFQKESPSQKTQQNFP